MATLVNRLRIVEVHPAYLVCVGIFATGDTQKSLHSLVRPTILIATLQVPHATPQDGDIVNTFDDGSAQLVVSPGGEAYAAAQATIGQAQTDTGVAGTDDSGNQMVTD